MSSNQDHYIWSGLSDDYQRPIDSLPLLPHLLLLLLGVAHFLQKEWSPSLGLDRLFCPRPQHNYFASVQPADSEECSICYEPLRTRVRVEDDKLVHHLVSRLKSFIGKLGVNVMQTPCRHSFHAVCLLNSMSHGLRCPLCKGTLPPIF